MLRKLLRASGIIHDIQRAAAASGIDWAALWTLFLQVLPLLLQLFGVKSLLGVQAATGSASSSEIVVQIKQVVAAAGFDWTKLLAFVQAVLPLIEQLIELFKPKS